MDATHTAINFSLHLPPGTTRIALEDLTPYSRRNLWQSLDGSASVEEAAVVARGAYRDLHLRMDVSRQPPHQDRAYAPFQRFADGTVAVYGPQFEAPTDSPLQLCVHYVPAHGEQVIGFDHASSSPLSSAQPWPPGYVAFGVPYVQRHEGLLLVSDRGAPAWIRQRTARSIPQLVEFYRQRLGPGTVPTIFLFAQPGQPSQRDFNGDHLRASLTLGLFGDGWKTPDESSVRQMDGFLAHELFHTWNSAPILGSPEGEALLAKEGGAEFARIVATAALNQQPEQTWLDGVSTSYNACLFELPAGRSIATALARRDPGRLPYDCGAPLMFALALAADRHDPTLAYFGLWRHLQQQHEAQPHADGYRWQDLLPANIQAPVRDRLVRAIEQPDAFPDAMRSLLRDLGVSIEPLTTLDADDRRNLIGVLMAHLMREDCAGSVSFWNEADGLLLDKPLPHCKSLHPGGKVVAVLGEPLAKADLFVLATKVAARCGSSQPVQIDYANQLPTSYLVCSKALPALPQPVHMTRLREAP